MSRASQPKGRRADLCGVLTPRSPGLGVKSISGGVPPSTSRGIIVSKYIIIGSLLMLAGCVSVGTNYDVAAVDKLAVGMTKAEVIGLLGKPNQIITKSDGTERLMWVHSTGSMFGATARSVGLPFGPDGKLTDVPAKSSN